MVTTRYDGSRAYLYTEPLVLGERSCLNCNHPYCSRFIRDVHNWENIEYVKCHACNVYSKLYMLQKDHKTPAIKCDNQLDYLLILGNIEAQLASECQRFNKWGYISFTELGSFIWLDIRRKRGRPRKKVIYWPTLNLATRARKLMDETSNNVSWDDSGNPIIDIL